MTSKKIPQSEILKSIQKESISLPEVKVIKHIKPKTENKIPVGFSVKLNFTNIYVAKKTETKKWEIQMEDGSDFLKSICPSAMNTFAEVCRNIAGFDKEGRTL